MIFLALFSCAAKPLHFVLSSVSKDGLAGKREGIVERIQKMLDVVRAVNVGTALVAVRLIVRTGTSPVPTRNLLLKDGFLTHP